MVAGLTLFLAEGFALSVFPEQFKALLAELEPRALQAAGLTETLVAIVLLATVLWQG